MSLKSGTLPKAPFEKKPKNHGLKYSYVPHATDTGSSLSKVAQKDSDRVVVRRRDELFKRVKIQTLAQHVRDHYLDRESTESVYALGGATPGAAISPNSVVVDSETQVKPDTLLILDVRDESEYEKCHLSHARSYPRQMLAHDKISAELYGFKSTTATASSQKKLVIYDTDDKATAKIATTMVEKGFANVYALSGGFEEVVDSLPDMLLGQLPPRALAASRPGSSCSRLSTVSRFTQMSTRR
ncbi:unnamed protein product [Amoebophrya sp. A25]|nr:unnamed protein product [Amoebophrya sp. A25]|eukprot:GSA25T00019642001.1